MKHIIISTVMIMLASQASVGQTLKTYSGLYEGGQATYTYFEDENGERIKHGKFTYNKKNNGVEAILDWFQRSKYRCACSEWFFM